jgi:hypothetical protein
MSQNISIHTQEGLTLVRRYIKYIYTFFIICILGPFLIGLFPLVIVLLLINIFAIFYTRCQIIFRAYEFYKFNSNPQSLYSPTGAVIGDLIPILCWFRMPKIITELVTNKPFQKLNSEGNKYLILLLSYVALSILQAIFEKNNFGIYLIFLAISVIHSIYFIYFDTSTFKRIYNIQNDQALELEQKN